MTTLATATLGQRLLEAAAELQATLDFRASVYAKRPWSYGMPERYAAMQAETDKQINLIRHLATHPGGLALVQFQVWLRDAAPTRHGTMSGGMLSDLALMFLRGEDSAAGEDWHTEIMISKGDSFLPDLARDDDEPT